MNTPIDTLCQLCANRHAASAACLLAQRRNVSPTPHQFQLIIILTISRHCRLKQTRVVHGLGRPVGWVGLSRDFAVFDGLGRI